MTDEPNVTKAVAKSVKKTQDSIDKGAVAEEEKVIKVSTGVEFVVKEVPQVAYVDLRNSLPEPSPPVFYNEEYDREEPNVNDPRYQTQHSNWEMAMSTAVMDINILFGSEIKSIPDDVNKPNSEDFKDKLNILLRSFGWNRKEIASIGKTERYLFWVKYEACKGKIYEDGADLARLFRAIGQMSGVPEEDVQETIEKFRD